MPTSLADQHIVFTGTLTTMTRSEASKKAILAGAGSVLSSLSKKATLVVAGSDAGAKLDKASDLGLEVIDEATFTALLSGDKSDSTSVAVESKASDVAPVTPIKTPAKKTAAFSTPSRGVFSSPLTKRERLENTPAPKLDVRSDTVSGKHICFTGALLSFTRSKAARLAERVGATVHSSVTAKVDIVIIGHATGQKLDKAQENGCEIWNEANFLEAIKYDKSADNEEDDDEDEDEDEDDIDGGKDDAEEETAEKDGGADSLKGQKIVFTGTLNLLKRADAAKRATKAGATVLSSLTKACTLVVAGTDAGAKLDKANEQGIEIWDEQRFVDAVGGLDAVASAPATKKAATPKKTKKPVEEEEEEEEEAGDDDMDTEEATAGGASGTGTDSLKGRHVVFTGTLNLLKRADAAKRATKAGATVLSSLTKACTLVVAGADAGAKLDKANEQGIEIWDEQRFVDAVGGLDAVASAPAAKKAATPKKGKKAAEKEEEEDEEAGDDDMDTEEPGNEASGSGSSGDSLKGKNVVFTGTLNLLKRADAAKRATKAGATVLSSLTKACTLVVAGADAGAKLDKANEQGIEIWDEQRFVDAVGGLDAVAGGKASKKRGADDDDDEEEEGGKKKARGRK
ncbi:hypothetical protein BCR33DRAFT_713825 [Rhizoclosmatium globosum]|uniref:BRCT domain-containing protein n=1 Tax=Rhizoclosmatium globosum TaxID=329046 RepID=A0A1Y2CR85_9FUNG|nr:hypothetical protein BCR33DRAFT_713825 [Rhizoclosmatium globosum]|eukprot:ORY49522.1 hypothetical protein BCR33DRAFT_713825 [Rhizoclosmatium globosum]